MENSDELDYPFNYAAPLGQANGQNIQQNMQLGQGMQQNMQPNPQMAQFAQMGQYPFMFIPPNWQRPQTQPLNMQQMLPTQPLNMQQMQFQNQLHSQIFQPQFIPQNMMKQSINPQQVTGYPEKRKYNVEDRPPPVLTKFIHDPPVNTVVWAKYGKNYWPSLLADPNHPELGQIPGKGEGKRLVHVFGKLD